MKTNILTLAAAVLMLSACGEKWLDVPSKSSVLESDYYNSDERLFTGVVAAYDPLEWFDYFYQYNSLNMVSDIMGDDVFCGGSSEGDQPVLVKTHYYSLTSNDVPNQIWTICYSGINRANIVLAKAPDIEMDPAVKARYVAECMILKAYYWNILWHFWGNVPYYEQNLTADENYSAEQATADQVYANAIKIVEDAIAMNALPMKVDKGQEGRITTAMAYMLYTEMVMYQNDQARYPTALKYMQEIISSGRYSLAPDFGTIFLEEGEWNSESIFEINFESEGGVHDWGWANGTGGAVYPVLIGIPGGTDVYQDGWGFEPVRVEAYDMYEQGDARRDATIFDFRDKIDWGTARWQATGLFLNKYIARKGGNHGYAADPNCNYGNNQRIYRYSETLLNAAELAVRLGQDGKQYLDQVRTRAGVPTVECTLDNILQERRLEFLGEGKRYWDLVRTGRAATVLTAANHEWRSNSWTESKKYWPIPQSEIDRSMTPLTQNPY